MTLLERDHNAPSAWMGDLPVTSRYTFGLAGERFFREIKENARIFGTRCNTCERTYVPAALFCERCMSELDEWIDVGTVGDIHTFTLLQRDYDGSPLQEPRIVALISFADGGLVHLLGEVDPDEVSIGLKVEAFFKPKAERKGSILDIEYFRPVKD
jgi:uncharacterized OB-fold protein